jgi:hypothetical protein
MLRHSSTVLNSSRKGIDTILGYREQYERVVKTSLQLLETTEDVLHSYTTKLDVRLGEQEYSLAQMQDGLSDVNDALPAATVSTNEFLRAVRWILWLTGGLMAMHGLLIALSGFVKPPPAESALLSKSA